VRQAHGALSSATTPSFNGNLYKIINRNSGKALDVNGAAVDQWMALNQNNRIWTIQ